MKRPCRNAGPSLGRKRTFRLLSSAMIVTAGWRSSSGGFDQADTDTGAGGINDGDSENDAKPKTSERVFLN